MQTVHGMKRLTEECETRLKRGNMRFIPDYLHQLPSFPLSKRYVLINYTTDRIIFLLQFIVREFRT